FNTRDGPRARLSVLLLTTLLTIPGDERQTPAVCRRAWPSPPSVTVTAQTNHRGQSQRDAADAHFMNIHGCASAEGFRRLYHLNADLETCDIAIRYEPINSISSPTFRYERASVRRRESRFYISPHSSVCPPKMQLHGCERARKRR
ncbi:hypothetical protein IRJ41_022542, partial [Triplophysa rosa]